jgi:hypothetical protein
MKAPRKFLAILSVLLLSSSCALFQEPPVPVPVFIESSIPVRERPKALNLVPSKFDVVSDKNLKQFLKENKKRNGSTVFIAMDVREYEATAYNFAEIDRYIKQVLALVQYYEDQIKVRKEIDVSETQ